MARKDKKKNKNQAMQQQPVVYRPVGPQTVYGMVPKAMPIAPPASHVQLTPIVQPVALVPYSTQSQPVSMIDDDYGYDEYDGY